MQNEIMFCWRSDVQNQKKEVKKPQWGGRREGAGAPVGNTNRKGVDKKGIAGWVTEEAAAKLEEAAAKLGKSKSFLVGAFVEKALLDGTLLQTMKKELT
jgi:hypothetical protein